MKFRTRNSILAALAAGIILVSVTARPADAPVTVTLDPSKPGKTIPPDFTGLSFEINLLNANAEGVHYFRPDNTNLITLFNTLGIKNLRVGGNTSDRDVRRLPDRSDISTFFDFVRAAHLKVIYCLRLHNGDPAADADLAKFIMSQYAAQMDCFSIGQEPSAYPAQAIDTRAPAERMGAGAEKYQYTNYAADWQKFSAAIIAAEPDVKFAGPGVHNNGSWGCKFMADFAHGHNVALITEHLYPGGAGGKVPTPEIGRDRMLSADFVARYQKLYDSFVPVAISNGLPYRLEEVNNYFNGGATNVSNTFASALWGLDFMYWWAAHDAAGLNFHTGDRVAAGNTLQASKYTAFFTSTNGYFVRPLGYGIKTFALGGHGQFIPAGLANPQGLNLSLYAAKDGGDVFITIINKEHGDTARAAILSLADTEAFKSAHTMGLTAPGGDIAATTGETLGGAQIQNDGSWNGTWTETTVPDANHPLTVPASSAMIIKLSE